MITGISFSLSGIIPNFHGLQTVYIINKFYYCLTNLPLLNDNIVTMIKLLTVSACIALFSLSVASAQCFVGLSTGISKDISDNVNQTFYHVPVMVQWKPTRKRWNVFFLEADYDIPISGNSDSKAYTLNPSLPQSITVTEKVRPYIFSLFAGATFHFVISKERNNFIYVNALLGICNQTFIVKYAGYDKNNYEVLNPDANYDNTSIVGAIEFGYKFHNNLMAMLHIQTGMSASEGNYPLSYRFVAPMQLTLGYNFYYNKPNNTRRYQ